jgi:hypothetical protein
LGDHCVAEGDGKYEVNVNLCVGIRHFFNSNGLPTSSRCRPSLSEGFRSGSGRSNR